MISLKEKDLAGLVYLFACKYSVSTGTLGLNLSFYFTFSDYITSHSRLLRSNQLLWWPQVCAVAHSEAEGTRTTLACCRRIISIELKMFKRLQQWKEKKNRNRLEREQRTTPLRLTEQMRGTRLIERLEEKASQVGGGAVHQGASPGRVEGETVFFCNYTKNSMHPQSFQSSLPSFAPVATSPFALSEGSLSFPNCETLWSAGLRAS